jgi:hypothetical protein
MSPEIHVDGFELLLVIACVAATVWFFSTPDAVFVVRFGSGNAVATSGHVTGAFLATVDEIAREFAILSGEVRGVARGRRIALRFSSNVPPSARQRLRNWWAEYGWSPPRRRPRRP